MTVIIIISTCISAIATAAIALYAIKSHKLADRNYQLAQEIKKANELRTKSEDEFRQQVSDLYKAIVVSTIIGSRAGLPRVISIFKEYYHKQAGGKTKIFE
jgi:single-stranded DNA-specific DHH superfamily exonuclease